MVDTGLWSHKVIDVLLVTTPLLFPKWQIKFAGSHYDPQKFQMQINKVHHLHNNVLLITHTVKLINCSNVVSYVSWIRLLTVSTAFLKLFNFNLLHQRITHLKYMVE